MAKAKHKAVKPGDVLGGKYRVERVIGEGGMGVVVAAKHIELHKRVAVKLLLEEALQDKEQIARFMREARAAVRLKSEHAARVLDVGKLPNGAPFMVMELLEGEDLGRIVERGPLHVADAVELILQACEAIAEAHALGIVHRDIKPRNLFLTTQVHGRPLVKVLDSGLAKTPDRAGADNKLTQANAVMGSPQYMSPEQMKSSRDVDRRTDIWSLGVCLYELIAGVAPYDAPSISELFARIIEADPPRPLTEFRRDVPVQLWDVVQRCLRKNPNERFANVAELAQALEPFAPASARGAAERVASVLYAVPTSLSENPPESSDGREVRTAATFESGSNERSTSSVVLMVGGGGIAVLAVAP